MGHRGTAKRMPQGGKLRLRTHSTKPYAEQIQAQRVRQRFSLGEPCTKDEHHPSFPLQIRVHRLATKTNIPSLAQYSTPLPRNQEVAKSRHLRDMKNHSTVSCTTNTCGSWHKSNIGANAVFRGTVGSARRSAPKIVRFMPTTRPGNNRKERTGKASA